MWWREYKIESKIRIYQLVIARAEKSQRHFCDKSLEYAKNVSVND